MMKKNLISRIIYWLRICIAFFIAVVISFIMLVNKSIKNKDIAIKETGAPVARSINLKK